MNETVTPDQMARLLLHHPGRLVFVAHVNPDGDGAGSALALAGALRSAGKNTVCAGLESMSDEYDYLEGISDNIPASDFTPLPGDAMVVIDCGATGRLVPAMQPHVEGAVIFCIDHHKDYSGFADYAFISEKSGSAAELVMSVIEAAGWLITRGIAEALWTGIVTDTGRFSYSSATPETFRRAARLLEAGARFDQINERIFNRMDLRRFRLRNRLLASFELSCDGKIAIASLGPEDYAAENCDLNDSENFIDIVRGVKGVEIAVFVREPLPNKTAYVSMRTTEKFDAAQICKTEWNGGGHARAAGAVIPGEIAEVRPEITKRLRQIIAGSKNSGVKASSK